MDLNLTEQEKQVVLSLVRVLKKAFHPSTNVQDSFQKLQTEFRRYDSEMKSVLDLLQTLWGNLSRFSDDLSVEKKKIYTDFQGISEHTLPRAEQEGAPLKTRRGEEIFMCTQDDQFLSSLFSRHGKTAADVREFYDQHAKKDTQEFENS